MLDAHPSDTGSILHPVNTAPSGRSCLDAEDGVAFAGRLTSAFRNHSHINNVLTHIAFGRWDRIEDALATLLTSSTDIAPSSPLARNMLDLLWAEGGITGRVMKPFFGDACRASLPPPLAERCMAGITTLASLTADALPLRASGVEAVTGFRRGE